MLESYCDLVTFASHLHSGKMNLFENQKQLYGMLVTDQGVTNDHFKQIKTEKCLFLPTQILIHSTMVT